MQKKIIKDLEKMFSHLEKSSYEQPHGADKTGNSIGNATEFEFKNGDSIRVICMDWSEEITEKNMIQSSGRYGIVVAARSEWIAIYHAVKDKPFLGHGSYPEDKNYYYSYKVAYFFHIIY